MNGGRAGYPAGVKHDPRAPWNLSEDPPETCPQCDDPNAGDEGPLYYDGFCSSYCEQRWEEERERPEI